MRRLALVLLVASACIPQATVSGGEPATDADSTAAGPPWPDDDGLSMTGVVATGSTTGGGGSSTADDAESEGDDATGSHFITLPDGGGVCGPELPPGTLGHCGECDPFDDDWCADGTKCMPWANDGGSRWNATRCSPIARDPAQLGEACVMMGSAVSGIDDCDAGLVCLHVDPDTLEGTCVPRCGGSQDDPECPDGTTCAIGHVGVIALCLPPCDPLADDCAPGTCTAFLDEVLACFVEGLDAAPGEPCTYPMDCAAGSTCLHRQTTGDCGADAFSCCASFCDLLAADPSAACLPGQTCTTWYRPGTVMPPLDAIGVCTLPE